MRSLFNRLVIGFFSALLATGMALQLLGVKLGEPLEENRVMAELPRPTLSLRYVETFPGAFNDWFKDNFAARDLLVTWYALFRTGVLRTSSNIGVFLGEHGQLYYTGDHTVNDALRTDPLSQGQLDGYFRTVEQRAEALARSGVLYAFVFCPNAGTMIPENLPRWLRRAAKGPNRIEQIMAEADHAPGVVFVDLYPVLKAKQEETGLPLYYKTDSHWNELGTYYGIKEVLRKLDEAKERRKLSVVIPKMPALPALQWVERPGGDLADMLGLSKYYPELSPWIDFPGVPARTRISSKGGEVATKDGRHTVDHDYRSKWVSGPAHPKVVVFRDSFFVNGEVILSQLFPEVRYVWGPYSEKIIEEEKPDLVIQQAVERQLIPAPL